MLMVDENSSEQITVYPGIYSPLNLSKVISTQQGKFQNGLKPAVSINEFSEYYQIKMPLPGYLKEDFVIDAGNGKLTIMALHTLRPEPEKPEQYNLQAPDCEYFTHSLQLPMHSDADFITAEYKAGVLLITIPKTGISFGDVSHPVVVY